MNGIEYPDPTVNYVYVSHDGVARQFTVRKVVESGDDRCMWCGGQRFKMGRPVYKLYVYGTMPEDSGRINWHRGSFCSKPCHDSYHG